MAARLRVTNVLKNLLDPQPWLVANYHSPLKDRFKMAGICAPLFLTLMIALVGMEICQGSGHVSKVP
jgi:hypothetical protein